MQDDQLFERRTHVPHIECPKGQPVKAAAVGQRVGRYELTSMVGRGGMGEVWRAADPHRNRPVVVKFLPPFLRGNKQELDRIRVTFNCVEALQHQHICPIYDFGEDAELGPYLVMKYHPGITLNNYMRRQIAEDCLPTPEQVRDTLLPIADALDYSHQNGVIHRDVKPDNVMVNEDGKNPQLVDFGIADEVRDSRIRLTTDSESSDTSGTRAYMAPEIWRGEVGNASSDQYSLGVVAYELLSGRLPFRANDLAVLRLSVLEDPIEAIQSSSLVNESLSKMLAKSPEERFPTCREAMLALHSDATAIKHRKLQLWAVAIVLVLVAAAAMGLYRLGDRNTPRQPTVSESSAPKSFENSVGMKFVHIPPGEFTMGSPANEEGHSDDETQQTIAIGNGFYFGAFEVTQSQYLAVMQANPSYFCPGGGGASEVDGNSTDSLPVEGMTWQEANEFCERLSARSEELEAGRRYRLPEEHEWEYACRGGARTAHTMVPMDSSQANIGNGVGSTVQIGSYPPNAFGIHDCHGNVWEWCQNWYVEDYRTRADSAANMGNGIKSFRGGDWQYSSIYCRSAYRERFAPDAVPRQFTVGIRVLCEID